MINSSLELNINTLINYTLKMFDKSEEILENSMKYMISKDVENAKKISKEDDEIDDLRDYIRDRSIELMALKQPWQKI
ncbi:phoU domain protein [[Clostridium] sordellii ATCC 9714]|nr:phoU domain protein [[Clostridium] sordellii ATCC 9714] [Paeniclostridium sordellii ATCC 9714]